LTVVLIDSDEQVRWPALATASLFLGYAAGKAVYAAQGKLGFPGGPEVPTSEYDRYAQEVMDVTVAQWLATATGVLGAVLVLATVTPFGRRLPRPLMLTLLVVACAGVGGGAVILVVDGFFDVGIGWSPWHGVLGLVVLALFSMTVLSYHRATRPR
jgi:hypothetical protein